MGSTLCHIREMVTNLCLLRTIHMQVFKKMHISLSKRAHLEHPTLSLIRILKYIPWQHSSELILPLIFITANIKHYLCRSKSNTMPRE